jgi:SAM-dependent methyltransferase
VGSGSVTAIDLSDEVIGIARASASAQGQTNLSFQVEDTYALSYGDDTFDVVYAHQVLQHLSDPVAALIEMKRVLRPDGLLAVRDADFGAFTWFPSDPRLDRWNVLYHQVTRSNHAEADAGRRLFSWVREAGFSSIVMSSSNWTFQNDEDRQWWGSLWADRVRHSEFARQALDGGLTSESELEEMAQGFLDWARSDDGVFIVVHGEVLGRV